MHFLPEYVIVLYRVFISSPHASHKRDYITLYLILFGRALFVHVILQNILGLCRELAAQQTS